MGEGQAHEASPLAIVYESAGELLEYWKTRVLGLNMRFGGFSELP